VSGSTLPLLSYGPQGSPVLWTAQTSGQTGNFTSVATDGTKIVTAISATSLFTSADGGVTWPETN